MKLLDRPKASIGGSLRIEGNMATARDHWSLPCLSLVESLIPQEYDGHLDDDTCTVPVLRSPSASRVALPLRDPCCVCPGSEPHDTA